MLALYTETVIVLSVCLAIIFIFFKYLIAIEKPFYRKERTKFLDKCRKWVLTHFGVVPKAMTLSKNSDGTYQNLKWHPNKENTMDNEKNPIAFTENSDKFVFLDGYGVTTNNKTGFSISGVKRALECPYMDTWDGVKCNPPPLCPTGSENTYRPVTEAQFKRGGAKFKNQRSNHNAMGVFCDGQLKARPIYCDLGKEWSGVECTPYDICTLKPNNYKHRHLIDDYKLKENEYYKCTWDGRVRHNVSQKQSCADSLVFNATLGFCQEKTPCWGADDGKTLKRDDFHYVLCRNERERLITCEHGLYEPKKDSFQCLRDQLCENTPGNNKMRILHSEKIKDKTYVTAIEYCENNELKQTSTDERLVLTYNLTFPTYKHSTNFLEPSLYGYPSLTNKITINAPKFHIDTESKQVVATKATDMLPETLTLQIYEKMNYSILTKADDLLMIQDNFNDPKITTQTPEPVVKIGTNAVYPYNYLNSDKIVTWYNANGSVQLFKLKEAAETPVVVGKFFRVQYSFINKDLKENLFNVLHVDGNAIAIQFEKRVITIKFKDSNKLNPNSAAFLDAWQKATKISTCACYAYFSIEGYFLGRMPFWCTFLLSSGNVELVRDAIGNATILNVQPLDTFKYNVTQQAGTFDFEKMLLQCMTFEMYLEALKIRSNYDTGLTLKEKIRILVSNIDFIDDSDPQKQSIKSAALKLQADFTKMPIEDTKKELARLELLANERLADKIKSLKDKISDLNSRAEALLKGSGQFKTDLSKILNDLNANNDIRTADQEIKKQEALMGKAEIENARLIEIKNFPTKIAQVRAKINQLESNSSDFERRLAEIESRFNNDKDIDTAKGNLSTLEREVQTLIDQQNEAKERQRREQEEANRRAQQDAQREADAKREEERKQREQNNHPVDPYEQRIRDLKILISQIKNSRNAKAKDVSALDSILSDFDKWSKLRNKNTAKETEDQFAILQDHAKSIKIRVQAIGLILKAYPMNLSGEDRTSLNWISENVKAAYDQPLDAMQGGIYIWSYKLEAQITALAKKLNLNLII